MFLIAFDLFYLCYLYILIWISCYIVNDAILTKPRETLIHYYVYSFYDTDQIQTDYVEHTYLNLAHINLDYPNIVKLLYGIN